jgi:2-polyprenyl-6-methoxyphenol hydroxylase and related FAD-dependent oxidoreductases
MKKGIIIGAGIGGLTTAIALAKKNFDVTVYEQADKLREVGAGIWVAPNGLKVFEKLGIVQDIIKAGNMLEKIGVVDLKGNPISIVNGDKIRAKHGYSTLALHRADLQKILVSHVPKEKIVLGTKFKSYRQTQDSIIAEFEDGSTAEADFIVNAAGLKSNVRERIQPDSVLRYSGQTCWRFVANLDLPKEDEDKMFEIWGNKKGLRAAYSKINQRQVYCYITDCRPAGETDNIQTLKMDLLNLCMEFPAIIKDLLIACDEKAIIRTDLFDFKPIRKWIDGRLVLIGDAAHATTPNLSQGACQAIEDAYVLAEELSRTDDIGKAFENFQSKRIEKATAVTNLSWQYAKMTNTSGLTRFLIKTAIRLTPESVSEKQLDKIYSLDY